MATELMPVEFFEVVKPLLPEDKPIGTNGGRPRVLNKVALRVIWYVLTTGIRWHDVLQDMGCSGRTAHRRLREWQALGIWEALHTKLLELLNGAGKLALEIVPVRGVPRARAWPNVRIHVRGDAGDGADSSSSLAKHRAQGYHKLRERSIAAGPR